MALHRVLASILLAGCVHLAHAHDVCQERAASVLSAAMEYVGVREATGHNDGREVEYFQHMTGTSKGTSWCGSFVFTAFVEGGVMVRGGGRAFAWSPTWHPPERQVWTSKRGLNPRFQGKGLKQPMPGDVAGLYYPELGRYGHTLLLCEKQGRYWITIEGNTSGGGSREGDGVYRMRRREDQLSVVSRWVC